MLAVSFMAAEWRNAFQSCSAAVAVRWWWVLFEAGCDTGRTAAGRLGWRLSTRRRGGGSRAGRRLWGGATAREEFGERWCLGRTRPGEPDLGFHKGTYADGHTYA